MKIKKSMVWLVSLLCGMIFTGCSKNEMIKGSMQEESAKSEKIIIWCYYETKQQKEGMDLLVKGFNESQNEYELSWEYKGPAAEFRKQLSIGVAEEELPDMVIIDNPDMRRYVNLGTFEDITDYVSEKYDVNDFYQEVITSVEYDDRYYGMPFCCNNVGLIYNKEMLKDALIEPPTDWTSFYQAAILLTNEDHYGFGMSAIAGEQAAFQLLPWILSTGADMKTLHEEDGKRALGLIDKLVKAGAISKECINCSQVDLARQFVAGKCAMMENGPWVLPILKEAGIEYGMIKLPAEERNMAVAGGENLAIIKGKNLEGAKAVIEYYYSDKVMTAVNQKMCSLPPKRQLADKIKNVDYEVFVEQMEHCISRSSYVYWPEISSRLSESLYGILTESMDVEEAAEHLREYIK